MHGTADQFTGCLLGLALGDALGAPHEGGPLERVLWRLIGTTHSGKMRWTDDTQMSLDLAESLVAQRALDPDDLAERFARSYRWSRGYGPGAAKTLIRIRGGAAWRDASRSVYPNGSLGNGGAMRAPVVGVAFCDQHELVVASARLSAAITHIHPLGIEGAVIIAVATAAATTGCDAYRMVQAALDVAQRPELRSRLEVASMWLREAPQSPEAVRERLGNSITAQGSCATAIYVAAIHLRSPFQDLVRFTAACGGDVDTIGAMAGGIWGAANGAHLLPEALLAKLEDRERIAAIAASLHAVASTLKVPDRGWRLEPR